jgi:ABC-type bacteriocin/lantibiotic exporter with double-glycine peptidase domain
MTTLGCRVAASQIAVLLIVLLSAGLIIPSVALPVFSKLFIDKIVLEQQQGWVIPLFLLFAATACVNAALTHLRQSLMLRLETKLTLVGASTFLWHVMRLPTAFFTQRSAGEIASRVDGSQRVAKVISSDMANAVIDWGTVCVFAVILVGYDAVLGLTVLLLALPNVVLLRSVQGSLARASRSQAAERGKLLGATTGMIQNIETIKASGLEGGAFAQWAGRHARTLEAARSFGTTSMLIALAPSLLRGVIQVLTLTLGAYRVLLGALTIGDLVAFQLLAASFAEPLRRLVALSPTLSATKADLYRVEDALRNPLDPLNLPRPSEPRGHVSFAGDLALQAVTYGYSPLDPPLLEAIDLHIAPGHRIALVGRSGCGKSTLGRLICGLLTPWSGEIRLDDEPLALISARQRAAAIAYVDQDIFLFEGTVRDNVTMWNPDVPDAVITRALEDAAILDDIIARPGQLDAHVEEGGRNFSGGQRQRLEIARALVGDPALLVLDEATAALDVQTEQRIDDNLRRRGCTCVIVAHRLSTVRDCSEIIVMRRGGIVERGTHDALLALDGEYAGLIRSI